LIAGQFRSPQPSSAVQVQFGPHDGQTTVAALVVQLAHEQVPFGQVQSCGPEQLQPETGLSLRMQLVQVHVPFGQVQLAGEAQPHLVRVCDGQMEFGQSLSVQPPGQPGP
jgi:hypothetical protein